MTIKDDYFLVLLFKANLNAWELRLGILESTVNGEHKNEAGECVTLASTLLAIADMGEA